MATYGSTAAKAVQIACSQCRLDDASRSLTLTGRFRCDCVLLDFLYHGKSGPIRKATLEVTDLVQQLRAVLEELR